MLRVIENSGTSRDEAIVIETDNHVVGVMAFRKRPTYTRPTASLVKPTCAGTGDNP